MTTPIDVRFRVFGVDATSAAVQQKMMSDGRSKVQSDDIGAMADAAATSDSGTFSVIAFIKRGLANWTTLLARIPALVSGRVPVDGSGVTQPISNASLTNIDSDIGAPADASATSDTGTFSLIALVKRWLTKATSIDSHLANIDTDSLAMTTSLSNLDGDLGAKADSAATSDTGTFSVVALIKRGLQNWTTILGRVPASVNGRVPVADSGEQVYTPGIEPLLVTALGDTVIYDNRSTVTNPDGTVGSATGFRIHRIYAVPVVRGSEDAPVITVKVLTSAGALYKTLFIGAAMDLRKAWPDFPLNHRVVINLDIAGRVPCNVDIEAL